MIIRTGFRIFYQPLVHTCPVDNSYFRFRSPSLIWRFDALKCFCSHRFSLTLVYFSTADSSIFFWKNYFQLLFFSLYWRLIDSKLVKNPHCTVTRRHSSISVPLSSDCGRSFWLCYLFPSVALGGWPQTQRTNRFSDSKPISLYSAAHNAPKPVSLYLS